MADPIQNLEQFSLAETDDGYVLEITGDGGGALTVAATPEQIDAIIDALDALLSDEDDAVDDDDGADDDAAVDEVDDAD